MPRVFFTGASDHHRVEGEPLGFDRDITFTRADDEPLPYADTTAEEAATLTTEAPDFFVVGDTPLATDEAPSEAEETPAPKAKAKKPAAKKKGA